MSMLDIIHTYTNPLERALALAVEGHSNQVDKQERPYILHCLRVMMAGETDEERIVGLLHDLLEDSSYEAEDLLHMEFTSEVVGAIVAITHCKGQSNLDYYEQVKQNALALRVKRYDIEDNVSRLGTLTDVKTRQRLTAKYQRAREVLFGEPLMDLTNPEK